MGKLFERAARENYAKTNVTDYIILGDTPITVQFLSAPQPTFKHWVFTDGRKLPFACLGANCPICERNNKVTDPDTDPDYIERQTRYAANVVDLTPVKICPECGTVNTRNATKCQNDECNTILVDVEEQPMGMVRYLEGSYTLYYADLAGLEDMLLEADPNFDITKVPLTIKKKKSENVTSYPIVPNTNASYAVNPDDYKDQLHDLTKIGIVLEPEELRIIMNGGSFKELMASKYGKKEENRKEEVDSIFG